MLTQEIHTAGEPYNAYQLYWYVEAWKDGNLVAMAEAVELPDAFALLAQRVDKTVSGSPRNEQ